MLSNKSINVKAITVSEESSSFVVSSFEQALELVMSAPGFGGKSKMRAALVSAINTKGPDALLDFLNGRNTLDVNPASYTKYVTPLKMAHAFPKYSFKKTKFDQYLTLAFDFSTVELDGNRVIVEAGYERRSASAMARTTSDDQAIEVTIGERLVGMNDARDIVYATCDDLSAPIYQSVLKGEFELYVKEPLAEEAVRYEPFIRSASNKRTRRGTFIRTVGKPNENRLAKLEALGFFHSAQAGKGGFVDVTKDRSGQAASNSLRSLSIKTGSQIVEREVGYDIVGGDYVVRVLPDVESVVKRGKAMVLDAVSKEIVEIDLAERPITKEITDGMAIHGPRVKASVDAVYGKKTSGVQFRFAPFGKGYSVAIPDFDTYFPGVDMVLFESTIKGDMKALFAENPSFEPELLLMKASYHKGEKQIVLPYQAIHATRMTGKELIEMSQPALDRYTNVANDAKSILPLLNKGDEALGMMTTLDMFLASSSLANEDIYIRDRAMKQAMEHMTRLTGGAPVIGEYKFMLPDVYAAIDAIVDGTFMIADDAGFGFEEGFTLNADGSIPAKGDQFTSNRMPSIGFEAAVITIGKVDARYTNEAAIKAGYFANQTFFDAHSLNVEKQGGADHDGDTSAMLKIFAFTKAVLKANSLYNPIIDYSIDENGVMTSGCPFEDESIMASAKKVKAEGITQDGYKIKADVWTKEAKLAALELMDDYDARTLEGNKIGLLTNYATMIHDAMRKVWAEAAIAHKAGDMEKVAQLKEELDTMMNWVSYLRLTQGYEIDRAKKGGAYEEALKDELAFIKDPGKLAYRLGFYKKVEGGKMFVWKAPKWMKGQKEETLSSMGMLQNHIIDTVNTAKSTLEAKLRVERASNKTLNVLTSSIAIEEAVAAKVGDKIRKMHIVYNASIRSSISLREQGLASENLAMINEADEIMKDAMAEAETRLNEYFYFMKDAAASRGVAGVSMEQFGAILYSVVYNAKAATATQGLSFAFISGAEYLHSAFMAAEGKDARPELFVMQQGRTAQIRAIRTSNETISSLKYDMTEGSIVREDEKAFVVFADGVRMEIMNSSLIKVSGHEGTVMVKRVIEPTAKVKANVLALELVLA